LLCLCPEEFFYFFLILFLVPKANGIAGFGSLNLFSQGYVCFGDRSLNRLFVPSRHK
jgi:hypothetical protein